jgi:uracil-DNA glycosylase
MSVNHQRAIPTQHNCVIRSPAKSDFNTHILTSSKKTRMEWFNIFPFQWNNEDSKSFDMRSQKSLSTTVITIWGWNENNESICVRVHDFSIPVWIECPLTTGDLHKVEDPNDPTTTRTPITWTDQTIETVADHFQKACKPFFSPVIFTPSYSIPLYNNRYTHHMEKDANGNMTEVVKPAEQLFIRVDFRSQRAIDNFTKMLEKTVFVNQLGYCTFRLHCNKRNLTPIMKLMTLRQLPSSNWIQGRGSTTTKRISNKRIEYIVKYTDLMSHPEPQSMPLVYPLVCSFDIEAYSADGTRFPDPNHPDDVVLQIGCTFARRDQIIRKTCLSIGTPIQPVYEGEDGDRPQDYQFDLITYTSERQLLLGFRDLVKMMDPDVLIGYNIMGFDIMYMHERARMCQIDEEFSLLGCTKEPSLYKNMNWESSARGKVTFYYYDMQGRIFIDALPLVTSGEKLASYKLEAVAEHYHLEVNKDPIKPKDIFKSYRDNDMVLFGKVAKYCVMDTVVTLLLFNQQNYWLGLTESATVNKVSIFQMVSQGQQIKAYSQVFDYCYNHGMVCNTQERTVKKPYRGAIVAEPISGLYNMILPFDFASLYPSIIIAHNIDFSTFLHKDDKLPEYMYDHFVWEDHVGCSCGKDASGMKPKKIRISKKDNQPIIAKKPKKIVCNSYDYRFLKSEYKRGVIPTIITELLAARKKVRRIQEQYEARINELDDANKALSSDSPEYKTNKEEMKKLKDMYQVLEKRQLAYKVNANSMYGMYGAETGYLPFFPGAETVTYVGRQSILKASHRLEEKHNGQVIYNDTDSAYTYFPHIKHLKPKEIFSFAADVVKDIATIFRAPMKLEFEGKIYPNFLILTKKRYVAQTVDEYGKLKQKLTIRGLPLVRRDYCQNMVQLYERCVRFVFQHIEAITSINKHTDGGALRRTREYQTFIEEIHNNFVAALSWQCLWYGGGPNGNKYRDFTIFKGMNKEKYETKQAHAEVAIKIRNRGTPVGQGARIEYVIVEDASREFVKDSKLSDCVDDLGYFRENSEVLRLNYLKYFESQYVNNFDVLIETIFGGSKPCTQIFKLLLAKNKVCAMIRQVFAPRLVFDDSQFDQAQYNHNVFIKSKIVDTSSSEGFTLEVLREEIQARASGQSFDPKQIKAPKESSKESPKESKSRPQTPTSCTETSSSVPSSPSVTSKEASQSTAVASAPYTPCEFASVILEGVDEDWRLGDHLTDQMLHYLEDEYNNIKCYPKIEDIFACFKSCSMKDVRVVLLGQDPYINEKQVQIDNVWVSIPEAMGLSFSVHEQLPIPASLQYMFQSLKLDLGVEKTHGDLTSWANQGVLLLNSALTVRAGSSNSHKRIWHEFTNQIIKKISDQCDHVVFILLGNDAKAKESLIDSQMQRRHFICKAGHPSPLNQQREKTFLTQKIFSRTNQWLIKQNKQPIRW